MPDELSRQMSQPDRFGFPPVLQEKYTQALERVGDFAAIALKDWRRETTRLAQVIVTTELLLEEMPSIEQFYALLKAREAANG